MKYPNNRNLQNFNLTFTFVIYEYYTFKTLGPDSISWANNKLETYFIE